MRWSTRGMHCSSLFTSRCLPLFMQGCRINCFQHCTDSCSCSRYTKGTQERGHVLGAVDDIVLSLDDNAMNLQSMAASRFVGPFLDKVQKWEKSLSHISEVVEVRDGWQVIPDNLSWETHHGRYGWWCSASGCTLRASSLGEILGPSYLRKLRSLTTLISSSRRYTCGCALCACVRLTLLQICSAILFGGVKLFHFSVQ